jgi:HD superfamily phosphohydrolase
MQPSIFDRESLSSDPIHGYIAYVSGTKPGEHTEQTLIDHPWLQRLRRIHQLQSAWWVYPSAEHTRFQHVLGAMHLASRAALHLYPSLCESCAGEGLPSQPYVDSLVRIAALLHDVGHGPYGHFFDDQFLAQFGLTHEDLGQHIILTDLADIIRGIRSNPHGNLAAQERLEPEQVAFLIKRPSEHGDPEASATDAGSSNPALRTTPIAQKSAPRWLRLLRTLFSGIYTVDNMDFVLRDSYMSGHGTQAFDLNRLLHYSFFTQQGLTLHAKGLAALERFIEARAKLFRSLYFHRTVRAMDLTLADIFGKTMKVLFPGNPIEHLARYQRLTEWSLLSDVERLREDADPERRKVGDAWRDILERKIGWKMACERLVLFAQGQAELSSIFTDATLVERRVREQLPPALRKLEFRADVARHYHRPTSDATSKQNFIYDPGSGSVRALAEYEQFTRLPVSFSLCRLYARDHTHDAELTTAFDRLLQVRGDDRTNM